MRKRSKESEGITDRTANDDEVVETTTPRTKKTRPVNAIVVDSTSRPSDVRNVLPSAVPESSSTPPDPETKAENDHLAYHIHREWKRSLRFTEDLHTREDADFVQNGIHQQLRTLLTTKTTVAIIRDGLDVKRMQCTSKFRERALSELLVIELLDGIDKPLTRFSFRNVSQLEYLSMLVLVKYHPSVLREYVTSVRDRHLADSDMEVLTGASWKCTVTRQPTVSYFWNLKVLS